MLVTYRLPCYNCDATGRAKGGSGYGGRRCPKCDGGFIEVVCASWASTERP